VHAATRWATTRSSTVNLHHKINFRALAGANLVTLPPVHAGNGVEVLDDLLERLVRGSLLDSHVQVRNLYAFEVRVLGFRI